MEKKPPQQQQSWREIRKENTLYEEYYRKVGVIPEGEFEEFMKALRTPLPTTFRVTRASYMAAAVTERLERMAASDAPAVVLEGGETAAPPRPIPWYPARGAWHIDAGRKALRKSPAFEQFHRFIVAQNEQGNITRQEAVSMVPPLLLDVRPESRVLDMCAAPGSKTTELVEILHSRAAAGAGLPAGFVVANELDLDRSFMLVHQTKKMASPCWMVTCSDAERFPRTAPNGAPFAFDRVLCDVPCSGDGTLRKNPDLWIKWAPRMAHRQHVLQIRIARRGLSLLRPGGRLVYSTCSLNPVEDEAVVSELLRAHHGAVSLVDVSAELPELRRTPGVSKWRVFYDAGAWADRHEDLPEQKRAKIAPTCFPPSLDEVSSFHLERCMRLLPHHQDTGGFFVAVLQKSATAPEETDPPPDPAATAAAAAAPPPPPQQKKGKKKKWGVKDEEPLIVVQDVPKSKEIIESVRAFYHVDPKFSFANLITRNKDLSKMLFVSPGIFELLRNTPPQIPSDPAAPAPAPAPAPLLRIVHAGLKLLQVQAVRQIVKCNYRLSMESLRWLIPHMGAGRVVHIGVPDILVLLANSDPKFSDLATPEARAAVEAIDPGCFALSVDKFPGMSLLGWRGAASCHLLIPKEELASLRNLLAPDLPPLPTGPIKRQRFPRTGGADAATATTPTDAPATTDPTLPENKRPHDEESSTSQPPPSPPSSEPPSKLKPQP